MHQSSKPPVRRAATIAVSIAATTVASVLGIGTVASAAPAVTTSATASPAATPSPSATTGRAAAASPAADPGDGSDLAFTEPSTAAAPLALTATVGTPFSHTFHTTGGTGTVGYAIQDAPNADYTVNVETGVLSGTPTAAGTFDFEVVALSGSTQITEYVRLTVAPSPLVFTEPSSKAAPLALTATAGTPFSHTFGTTGGTGSLAYAIQDSPSEDLTVNVETGVLTSTVTTAGTYDFEVVALRGTATATEYVRLTVLPAAPVGVLAIVNFSEPAHVAFSVAPDGTITGFDGAGHSLGTIPAIEAAEGSTLEVSGLAVDRFGNVTAPGSAGHPAAATVTSSVASDRVVRDASGPVSRVTFPHASEHRLTITQGGVSTTFAVEVSATVAVGVTTTTHTSTGTGTTPTLAYTGADETTPLAWALGLFASGASLLLYRLRRRRV
jgi:non-canonical (house-cleaning) NTP pyrophosphatase